MSFSYSFDPGGEPLDQVRFLIQDVRRDRVLLADEEIAWLLGQTTDPYQAASWAAEAIAARYTGSQQSISADGVSVTVGDLSQQYLVLAGRMRQRSKDANGSAPIPYAGGLDPAEDCMDGDVAPLAFGTGQWDNPAAGRQDYGRRGGSYPSERLEWA